MLSRADDRAAEHRRLDGRVEAKELAARLEPAEEVVEVLGLGEGLQREREALDGGGDQVEWLPGRPVHQPGVPRPDPADLVGIDVVVEQEAARVHGGLAGAEHGEARGRFGDVDELADRDQLDAFTDGEPRRVRRRHRGLEVGGVDQLPAHPHRRRLAGEPRAEGVFARVVAEVVALPEEADLTRARRAASSSTRRK